MDRRNDRGFNVINTSTRYNRGGTSDVFDTRVGWWERATFVSDPTDLFYDINTRTAGRPDLISFEVYGDPVYAWFVLQFNNIIDINEELVVGRTVMLPTPSRMNSVLLTNTSGSNRITSS